MGNLVLVEFLSYGLEFDVFSGVFLMRPLVCREVFGNTRCGVGEYLASPTSPRVVRMQPPASVCDVPPFTFLFVTLSPTWAGLVCPALAGGSVKAPFFKLTTSDGGVHTVRFHGPLYG